MDQGVNFGFNSQGIDPATFGLPVWADGWHKVVIIGSAARPLSDPSKGGRMQFKIKCIEGPEAGKEHFIGLNLYHNDPTTRARAESEMASICHVTGKFAFQNTAELYNIPFYVQAVTETQSPTPQYPNPKPQTNFRGYKDLNGNEPGKSGGAPAGPGAGGPPAGFGQAPQQGQPQFGQAPQGQPQFGAPQFGQQPGGQQPQFGQPGGAPQFGAPQAGAPGPQFGGAPQGGPAPQFGQQPNPQGQPQFGQPGQMAQGGQPQFGAPQGGGVPFQPNAGPTGFQGGPNGGNAQSPFNGQPQQGQAPQWGPQGAAPQGGQPQFGQPQQGGWPGQ